MCGLGPPGPGGMSYRNRPNSPFVMEPVAVNRTDALDNCSDGTLAQRPERGASDEVVIGEGHAIESVARRAVARSSSDSTDARGLV